MERGRALFFAATLPAATMLPYRGAHGKDNMAYDSKLKEEEIKNKVAADLFPDYDCTRILGNVDFCVQPKVEGPTLWETESLLWAEAKAGVRADFAPLFAQLVLTVGSEKTFEKHSPPPFLGAFDCEKIAFLPWHVALDLFFRSDVDWSATPSDVESPAFRHVLSLVRPILDANLVLFHFGDPDLAKFAKKNLFVGNGGTNRLPITRNNFPFVYQKWVKAVKPSIAIDWTLAKKQGILDADFFLADLLSKDNTTLLQNLFVVLRKDHYLADRKLDAAGFDQFKSAGFKDGQKAHTQFWNQYRRPPRKEFWAFINDRRDLLMPPDIREREGSFFTPQIWVEKAQETIAAVLGEDWQDNHYVWDCAGGTGNLVAGLDPKAKYRVWVSTLQPGDVSILHERIQNGAALLDSHVFQFDFLNDSFDKLPQGLRDIVENPEERKKLVVFINPPYAEAGNIRTTTGTGENKPEVAKGTAIHTKYKPLISSAANEMFALFLIRIAKEIPGCILAQFSTLKHIQAPNFKRFREYFSSRLEKAFVVPAKSFDNVNGEFPIGFFVWRTESANPNTDVNAEVFSSNGESIGTKRIFPPPPSRLWMDWLKTMHDKQGKRIGYFRTTASDFQNQMGTFITSQPSANDFKQIRIHEITKNNILWICTAFAVRLCIAPDWLNDRDQFLWPADSWKADAEFQLDCLAFALFHGQNRISCKTGTNHWIPFSEDEVGAKDAFKSHFMSDFLKRVLAGRDAPAAHPKGGRREEPSLPSQSLLFPETAGILLAAEAPATWDATGGASRPGKPPRLGGDASPHTSFSSEAQSVFDTGRELWRYYHAQPGALPDASFYDIRAHFQGFKPNGHMNADSSDPAYTELVSSLRSAERALAAKLAPKVREHGFLR